VTAQLKHVIVEDFSVRINPYKVRIQEHYRIELPKGREKRKSMVSEEKFIREPKKFIREPKRLRNLSVWYQIIIEDVTIW
jgi:hypothetical protein